MADKVVATDAMAVGAVKAGAGDFARSGSGRKM
jgi:hypothetical protein